MGFSSDPRTRRESSYVSERKLPHPFTLGRGAAFPGKLPAAIVRFPAMTRTTEPDSLIERVLEARRYGRAAATRRSWLAHF